MRIYVAILCLGCLSAVGQSLELNPSNGFEPDMVVKSTNTGKQVVARFEGTGQFYTSLYINNKSSSNAYIGFGLTRNNALRSYFGLDGASNFFIGVANLSAGDFKISGENATFGNVGIGMGFVSPTAKLEVNGFTKLGTDAPAIKTKLISHTTAAAQGVQTTVAHGLSVSKIIGIQALVKQNITSLVTPGNESAAQVAYDVRIEGADIVIFNRASNSSNILGKPITILITYIE